MKLRRVMDLMLVLIGSAIILVSYFYLEGTLRWMMVVVSSILLLIFVICAIRDESRSPLREGAPMRQMPPAAKVTEAVLLNEEDRTLASWTLYGKVSMLIGRDSGENQVDVSLSSSAYASTVDVEHAVLNYTDGTWYVEDLASHNGVSVQSIKDGRKYKLAPFHPCKLDAGDIIHVGLVRLLIR